jgi:hypothetical protein
MEPAGEDDCPSDAPGIEGGPGMQWNFWRRRQRDADLDAEIAFDIAREAEENVQAA